MGICRSATLGVLLAALPLAVLAQDQAAPDAAGRGAAGRGGRGGATITVWAPKPDKAPYIAPNKPQVKVADLIKKHARQTAWSETVVRDAGGLTGRYIQMAPGTATKTQFYVDSSMFFIVEAGQMRVTLQGQEPFTATKGFIVQVPARVQYAMEAIGDAPALRFEVTHTVPCPSIRKARHPWR